MIVPAGDLPRVLILSGAVPETKLAGSLLLYRLFKDYPVERLRSVGPALREGSERLASEYRTLAPARSARLNLTRFAALKRSLEALGLVGRISAARIAEAMDGFHPDVVLSVMERGDYLEAAYRVCRQHHLPLVLIVHDRLESFELVYPPFRGAQRRRLAEIYRFAAARLCVSPEMETYLRHRYGAAGSVLYPNRSEDLEPRAAEASRVLVSAPTLTIGYAGSLAYGYGERLEQVMPVLARAGVSLLLFSRDELRRPIEGVSWQGHCDADTLWRRIKAEVDAVWLPYSYESHYRQLYATHFPSKLTEYLALGMPVIISGPSFATGVQWGLRHPEAALTLPDDTPERLVEALKALAASPDVRVSLASGARQSSAEFDPVRIRSQFLQVLSSVAAGPRH